MPGVTRGEPALLQVGAGCRGGWGGGLGVTAPAARRRSQSGLEYEPGRACHLFPPSRATLSTCASRWGPLPMRWRGGWECRRYRICTTHAFLESMDVNGTPARFCQVRVAGSELAPALGAAGGEGRSWAAACPGLPARTACLLTRPPTHPPRRGCECRPAAGFTAWRSLRGPSAAAAAS